MKTTRLLLVGGFLGAGKTTLLAESARRLAGQGKRVALLANDQAPDLVDSAVMRQTGSEVEEVAGGCFCCRFPDMTAALDRLRRQLEPDVVLAEPVGSCTDLSATVLQPLKKLHREQYRVGPYSVLVDVNQAGTLLRLQEEADPSGAGFDRDVLYIYRKQLEEADLIVLNKTDLVPAPRLAPLRERLQAMFPGTPLAELSASVGDGIDAWLERVFEDGPAGTRITEVDYDVYAHGEAVLGWMNASGRLSAREDVEWRGFVSRLLALLQTEIAAEGGQVAHLKLFLTTGGQGHIAGNLTQGEAAATVRGEVAGGAREVSLLINARVQIHADRLRQIVERCLAQTAGDRIDVTMANVRSFFPGRPMPTHRFAEVEAG